MEEGAQVGKNAQYPGVKIKEAQSLSPGRERVLM